MSVRTDVAARRVAPGGLPSLLELKPLRIDDLDAPRLSAMPVGVVPDLEEDKVFVISGRKGSSSSIKFQRVPKDYWNLYL